MDLNEMQKAVEESARREARHTAMMSQLLTDFMVRVYAQLAIDASTAVDEVSQADFTGAAVKAKAIVEQSAPALLGELSEPFRLGSGNEKNDA